MSKMQKTKQGVAAIYVVVFTTMLIGIITLSFLRIMLSESGRTLNDTLSDSAYNSALAGVEDAKFVVSKYEKAIAAKDNDGLVELLENEADKNNCDIISDAMNLLGGSEETNRETPIGSNSSFQDQAYTCVTINLEGDFKGELSANNPTLVVPLKPKNADTNVNNVKYVEISWYMNTKDSNGNETFSGNPIQSKLKELGLSDASNNENAVKDKLKARGVLGRKGIVGENTDNEQPTKMNGIRAMIIQSQKDHSMDANYYSSDTGNKQTNRASLMILPSADGKGINDISIDSVVDSADKTLNAPVLTSCENDADKCVVRIAIPAPIGGGDRDPNNFFLVLNNLYSEPAIKVTVRMLNSSKNPINFFNVQPIIDSTGRSGDLFRRVEARIGTDNGASLIPTAELSTNGNIDKSFYVTKNCIKGTEACDK